MRFIHSNAGMSIVELMVAVMILSIGLSGVAGMQMKALQGNNFAGTLSTGSNAAQSWLEWYNDFVNQQDQNSILFNGKLCREHFARLSMLDTNPNDSNFTELELYLRAGAAAPAVGFAHPVAYCRKCAGARSHHPGGELYLYDGICTHPGRYAAAGAVFEYVNW
jgi:prepilin-type N-terminal cleavage/methylation domain-containing protein